MTDVATVRKHTVDRMQVRIEHLDTLLSLAGEVIITSANLQDLERRINHASAGHADLGQEGLHLIKASNEATRRISQNLHDLVMAIRLVEIGETFRLLRRPVRNLCRSLGREVDIEFEGDDTLIDKALAEHLVDPLLHLLRNAVDHGIEPPIDRKGAGKPVTGRIVVRAVDFEHETEIQVRDDGAGVDVDAVRAAAGELLGEKAERLSLVDLLCQPGLTTAGEVTATSGRGVGLDIVRTTIDDFDGTLELATQPHQGTVFTLHIPKLRAVNIIDALTFRAGDELYALPIDQVVANIALRREDIGTAFDRSRHFLYHDEVVPLHNWQGALEQPMQDEVRDPLPVIILRSRTGQAAFTVTEFLGPQKLVNIPLDEGLDHHPAISGTAVFTGGKLGLTVDVDTLVAHSQGDTDALDTGRKIAIDPPAIDNGATIVLDAAPAMSAPAARPTSSPGDGFPADSEEAESLRLELTACLQGLQDDLLSLETAPDSREKLDAAFRRLHAAKGHLTVLEAEPQAVFAHHLETVLDYLRAERFALTPERMDLILDAVTVLTETASQLPGAPADPPAAMLASLQELTAEETVAAEDGRDLDDLVRQPFDLSSTVQLQILSALKRGERTFETYLGFDPGRQPSFLAAYLLLRRIGTHGTVLATLPSIADIESGRCGREVKVLWTTALDEPACDDLYDRLAGLYNLNEHRSIPTTIFRYEGSGETG